MNRSEVVHEAITEGWVTWLISGVVAGVSAYFTTTGAIKSKLVQLEERESNHYKEVIRRLDAIDSKL
jgi:hypothetical protein